MTPGSFPISSGRYRAVAFSAGLSALAYLAFALSAGWHQIASAMGEVGVLGTGITLVMSLVNYGLRFLRWQRYLSALGHPMAWRPSLRIYLAGFALTTTPGKAGEALRGVLLKPWGIPYSKSFAAFFSERLSDLFAIVLLTLLGLTWYPEARPVIALGATLVVASFVVLGQRSFVRRLVRLLPGMHGRISGLLRHLLQVLVDAQQCHRPGLLMAATSLSVAAWSVEAVAFHWILGWIGADIPLSFATFVYAMAMLVGALSFMPGGVGGAEAAIVTLLVWKGMPLAGAVAATLLIRLATLWFAVGIGIFSVLRGTR